MPANAKMVDKMIGLMLLICGISLVFWGYQLSGAFTAQLTKELTGALPAAVMYRYISGAISSVVGLYLLVK
jgi:hypothetical protein